MEGEPIGECYKCGAKLYATLGLCNSCELEECQAENKRLKEVLLEYGWHKNTCAYAQGLKGKSLVDCDCGFEQALKGD